MLNHASNGTALLRSVSRGKGKTVTMTDAEESQYAVRHTRPRYHAAMTKLLLALVLATAATAGAADVVKPAGLYLSLSAADLGSTAWARQNGASEGNPFMSSNAVAKQLAVAGILTAVDVHLQKKGHHRKLRVLVTVLRVAAVVVNVTNARKR